MTILRKKLSPLAVVVILDFVGILCIGLGLHIQLNGGSKLLPPELQSEKLPMVLIISGALLMLPMIGYFMKRAGGRAPKKPHGID